MGQTLTLHPQSRCAAVSRIAAEAARPRRGGLVLRYVVTGAVGDLGLPPVGMSERAHGLWRHTCFEAFVGATRGGGYYEFNFAPSGQWAAYRFDGYRTGMSDVGGMSAPRIEARSDVGTYELQAELELGSLSDLPVDASWPLGLCAVIKERGGRLSYWALAHVPGNPDFHHSDCFACEVAPAWRP